MKHKVVFHWDYGGFAIPESCEEYLEANGVSCESPWEIERHNPHLVRWVEQNPELAERLCLHVKEIEGNRYWIEYYDGAETVRTPENMGWVVIPEDES